MVELFRNRCFTILLLVLLAGSGCENSCSRRPPLGAGGFEFSSDDGFADDLVVPEDIDVAEPVEEVDAAPGGPEDSFQAALLAALKKPGDDDPSVTASLDSLALIEDKATDILIRYLVTSPSWRMFEERGLVFATRRWMVGSNWRYNLHGYYTKSDISRWSNAGTPNFQSRLTLGFSAEPWARVTSESTRLRRGQTAPLTLSVGNLMHESHCVITLNGIVVEVFEQSGAKERRLTKAALAHLEKEFAPLAQDPTWKTVQAIVPAGSIGKGTPSLQLEKSFQPGIYNSVTWVNPGEPGMVYLKAFEVTRGTRLSADSLKEYSCEWIGWSDDPSQLFFSNTHFTIYEGDWEKPYAARFEVWFVPISKKPERKLLEKVFRIEGWQH